MSSYTKLNNDNSSNNKEFWDYYYKNNRNDIIKESSFSTFVYENYIHKYNKENVCLKIADIGCGNCRDSIFFSQKANKCYAIDINSDNDNKYMIEAIKEDAEEFLKNHKLQALLDIIYMRWLLHSAPYMKSKNIFKYAINNLKPGGLLCIEVRSLNDLELIKNSKYNVNDE